MLLFIEGYPYSLNDIVKDGLTVRDVLKDVGYDFRMYL